MFSYSNKHDEASMHVKDEIILEENNSTWKFWNNTTFSFLLKTFG
jgi:hypothetical protein